MSDRTELARNRVGHVLRGKLRLDAVLGVGGMAAVYSATHRNGKRVAVKMLHPEFSADEEARTRFLREGYAANTIGHPGCVSVTDDDVAEDGSVFVVMELLEGETLDARALRLGGRLPPAEVVHWTIQLLDVLVAAHDKGVIHRDIKPENVFATQEGRIKVLDFGIARTNNANQAKLTVTGAVMGTPAFMPPEQALAKWDLVDARSDLWSVGATMFFLLTGRLVHEEEVVTALLIAIATKPVPSIKSLLPSIPPALAAIVDRALTIDRTKRFPDARAMQEALRAAASTSPELSMSSVVVPTTADMRATTSEHVHGRTALGSSPSFSGASQGPGGTLLTSTAAIAQRSKLPMVPLAVAGVVVLGVVAAIGIVRSSASDPASTTHPEVQSAPVVSVASSPVISSVTPAEVVSPSAPTASADVAQPAVEASAAMTNPAAKTGWPSTIKTARTAPTTKTKTGPTTKTKTPGDAFGKFN